MAAPKRRGEKSRRHPRLVVDPFARVFIGKRSFVFRTRDLSRGGLFLYTRIGHLYPFKVGSSLRIQLYDFDRAVKFEAVVVRIVTPGSEEAERYPLGFALRIVAIDEENRKFLDSMIERAARGEVLY